MWTFVVEFVSIEQYIHSNELELVQKIARNKKKMKQWKSVNGNIVFFELSFVAVLLSLQPKTQEDEEG